MDNLVLEMKKYIVITSIHNPSKAIREYAGWKDWQLVVVGDRKSPEGWHCEGVVYLGLDEQYEMFGEFAKRIPENTYIRKMLGYIYAIRNGADVIFESDDDNIPYVDANLEVEKLLLPQVQCTKKIVRSNDAWVNIYALFGQKKCWPRGFPLSHLRRQEYRLESSKLGNAPVVQFLADVDPDVDAIYRMLNDDEVLFAKERSFSLAEGTHSPFNSQATLWLSSAFPLLFFPIGVTDRTTDILRGYIALSCMWAQGVSLEYRSPIVYQERNPHNLKKDFDEENFLYTSGENVCERLREVNGLSFSDCYLKAIEILVQGGLLDSRNHTLYQHFLSEINIKEPECINF